MDLGIRGRKAIVCAGSKGLGRGCAMALAEAGVDLILNARGADALAATANDIEAATGVSVIPVAADITTHEGRAAVLDAAGAVDILVTNAGGPLRACGPTGRARISSRRSMRTCLRRSR